MKKSHPLKAPVCERLHDAFFRAQSRGAAAFERNITRLHRIVSGRQPFTGRVGR